MSGPIVFFEVLGEIQNTETFAHGSEIRELGRLRKQYGIGNWRKRKGIASVRLADGTVRLAEIHWYEATSIGKRDFVVCVYNDDYAASLELRKLYEVLPDEDAEKNGQVRIIDESGEDYLYPDSFFAPVQLPALTEERILRAP